MGKSILFVVFIFLFLAAGCGEEEPAIRVDLSKKENVRVEKEANVITYAYLPQYSHTVSYRRHHLLVEYLRRETGLRVKQIFPDTYDEHVNMVGQGTIDISYSNPFIYIKIAHRYGARAFARSVENYGQKNFRGLIITRTDNPFIRTINDCRGKRWIAVDPKSSGGYLYPLGHFMKHGIKKEDFSEIAFSPGPGGKQEKVVLAVYAGKYDVGTIREGTLNVVADKIDVNEIRVIDTTPWYPGWLYAARMNLEPEIVAKIQKAFFKLDNSQKECRQILAAADIIGIISAEDQDFNPVRDLAERVGISLDE